MTARKQWKYLHHNARMAVRCNRDPNINLTINGRTVWIWRGLGKWYVLGKRESRGLATFYLGLVAEARRTLMHRGDVNRTELKKQAWKNLAAARTERKRQANRTY